MLSNSMVSCVTIDDREGEGRQNHQRNEHLREDGGKIRNRQRFPKQNAAIATFAVQRIETVEDAHDEHGEHDHHGRDVVRHLDGGALRRVDSRARALTS